jgi:hypothetical protein
MSSIVRSPPGHTLRVGRVALLLTAVALAASVAALASARATTRPTLRLMDARPVVFRGLGFKAHESVRVSVYAGERVTKRVTSGARGGFVVRFSNLDPNSCTGFGAVAVGNEGSRASFKRAPGMCPAP